MRMLLNNRYAFYALLAIPGAAIAAGLFAQASDIMEATAQTGEWSARLMIAAMMIGPLTAILGPRAWLRWLTERRRAVGVAAFLYALLHTAFYLTDMGEIAAVLDELLLPGIWTGWAAILLMLPVALSSNNASMRALKQGWKSLQRLVYPAAVLTLLHWVWVHSSPTEAIVHFVPLLALQLARIFNFKFTQKAGA